MKLENLRSDPFFKRYFIYSYFLVTIATGVALFWNGYLFWAIFSVIIIAIAYTWALIWLLDYWSTLKSTGMMLGNAYKLWREQKKNAKRNKTEIRQEKAS